MRRPRSALGFTQTATVIGVVVGLIMLSLALSGISKTEKTIIELGNLANISNKQLEILVNQSNTQNELLKTENQAVVELAHQTIMQVYNLEKSHKVDISSCYYYPSEQKIILQLGVLYNVNPDNPNSKDLPSTITFEIMPRINAHLDKKGTKERLYSWSNPLEPKLIGHSKENKLEFSLSDIFEIAKNKENSELYVSIQYSFAPYSAAKNIGLSDPIEQAGPLLLGLEENENDEWVKINNPNIVCK